MKVIPLDQDIERTESTNLNHTFPTSPMSPLSREMMTEFLSFQRKEVNSVQQAMLLMIVSCGLFYMNQIHQPTILNIFLFTFISVFVIIVGWFTLVLQYFMSQSNSLNDKCILHLQILEKTWFLAFNASLLLEVVSIVVTSSWCEFAKCYSKPVLPETLIAVILFAPLICSVVIPTIRSKLVLFTSVFNFVFIVCFAAAKFHDTVLIIAVVGPLCFIVLWEYQRQKLTVFHLSRHLRVVEAERDRLQIEVQADDLKHLIGNVAHDLKTVRWLLCFVLTHRLIFLISHTLACIRGGHGH